jgi:AmmeMemoRadiSam system protein B
MFYPADAGELRAALDAAFADSRDAGPVGDSTAPKAIVAPHAGYIYSGAVAASAYRCWAAARAAVRRVVLLGPSHRVPLDGLAVPAVDAFETPLGPVDIDREGRERALRVEGVVQTDGPHAPEHSLEVQLPFLQVVLEGIDVLPIVVGRAPAGMVAEVIEQVWGGAETLLAVSTDLSHYHDHASAQELDRATARAVEQGRPDDIGDRDACGAYPLRGLLEAAGRHGLSATTLDLRNSGDTAGPRDRVVGYGAFAFR